MENMGRGLKKKNDSNVSFSSQVFLIRKTLDLKIFGEQYWNVYAMKLEFGRCRDEQLNKANPILNQN